MYCGDEIGALVGDIGFGNSKFGYAGEDFPKAVVPSFIAKTTQGIDDTPTYRVGSEAKYPKADTDILNPFDGPDAMNWEVVEKLWAHCAEKMLSASLDTTPTIIVEPDDVPQPQREKYVELMFEKFQVPSLYLAKNSVMTAFSVGRATCLVIDFGAQSIRSTPVHDGYNLRRAAHSTDLGGHALAQYTLDTLQRRNIAVKPRYLNAKDKVTPPPGVKRSFHEFLTLEVARDIVESQCEVKPPPTPMKGSTKHAAKRQKQPGKGEESDSGSESEESKAVTYELPDGTALDLTADKFKIPELLFDPSPITGPYTSTQATSLPLVVHNSLLDADPDLRKDLCNNIVVVGGGSCLRGLLPRLHYELVKRIPPAYKPKILFPGYLERCFSTWIGGSILGSLGTMHQLWMSRSEYEEEGPGLVERKCP